ncbi:DNA ligase 4 [Rhizoctonia solani]|uniref:DNA ligase n=1 Tax=Rhizoctonia solani TaxID=456999 RepID=A0A0K6FP83_9AGAM|nr:DNA ligase 4 [Rhizoctonia solani]
MTTLGAPLLSLPSPASSQDKPNENTLGKYPHHRLDIPRSKHTTMSSPHTPPEGVYRISDGRGRWLSESGVKPGTGAGTQLVLLTEEEGTDAGFTWNLGYDKSHAAYTLRNAASGLYASFEGDATEHAHLGAHTKPRYYDLVPVGARGLNDCDHNPDNTCQVFSPLMNAPPSPPLSAVGNDALPEPSAVEPLPLLKPAGVFNHGPSPLFSRLADLFEALRLAKGQEKRKTMLLRWFANWREKVGTDLYPALRLILPEKDRERAVYGLKESSLAKCFLAAMGIDPKSVDGKRVLNWKKPTPDNPTVGDFTTTLYQVLEPRCPNTHGTLTIDRLNELLDELTKGARNLEMQMRVVRKICDACTAVEQRWIVRIILKDLAVQVKETSVLGVFHPDARDLFNTCSDLKRAAWELWNPERSLKDDERDVTLWTPFQPMLCKRSKTLAEAVKLIKGHMDSTTNKDKKGQFVIEEKLDGERMQLHKRGNAYFYSSRKGTDYTYLYGAHVGAGSLTPYIHAAFDDRIEDCILDGEMMVWDPMLDKYLAFGTLKTAAADILGKVDARDEDSPRPCFKVFDILLLRNPSSPAPRIFSNTPLSTRRKLLVHVFKPVQGRFELATQSFGSSAKDVETALEKIVEEKGEGLVLKAPDSPYVLAGREAFWVKVKPEYMDSMSDSVDVLVIAGNWGSGRRGGKVSSLICAVRDDYSRAGVSETGMNVYATFVRIGTGLSIEDYDWVNKKKWIRMDKKAPPPHMKVSSSGKSEDKGDVYLDPEDWFIISVKAASITVTDEFGTNLTMRFPRCKTIRRDLAVDDCLTWSELRELHGGKRKDSDDRQGTHKRRKIGGRKPTTLSASHQATNVKGVEVLSNLFEDMRFLVIPDLASNNLVSKAVIEKLIHQHGGDFTQVMQGDNTLTVVYGGTKLVPQVKRIMKREDMDILKPQWLTDSIDKGRLVPLQAKYYFFATREAQEDEAYNMGNGEIEILTSQRGSKSNPAQSTLASKPPLSPTSEPEEWSEYLQPVSLEDVANVPDDPSASDTQSEPEDLADQLSDDGWTEVISTPVPANISKPKAAESSVGVPSEISSVGRSILKPAPATTNSGDDSTTIISAMRSDVNFATSKLDQNLFFRNLCFFLDSPDNARQEGFLISSPHEHKIRLR